jgi:protein arginine kinase activator
MQCELCHVNHATIHITEIVNTQKRELHLCDDCARQKGVTHKIQLSLSDLLGGMVEAKPTKQQKELQSLKCVNCGMTFNDLRTKMRLGCANDLEVFKEWLGPFVEKVHGATQHVGKVPRNADVSQKLETELLKLKKDLDEAVRREDFEQAARLRDQIKSLEPM